MSWVAITFSWLREHVAPESFIAALDQHVIGQGARRLRYVQAEKVQIDMSEHAEDAPTEEILLGSTTVLHVPSVDVPAVLEHLAHQPDPIGGVPMVRVFGLWRILCLPPHEAHRVRMELEDRRTAAEARHAAHQAELERRLDAEIEARRRELPLARPKRGGKKKRNA